jgi:flagellin
MSLGVLTNIAAIYAENNLNKTQSSLQNTLTQLSSGSRINSGADDAAGLSVVDGLQANVSALTQSSQNASDGIGLLQTADGALSQVTNLLNRAVTLATEAANGTLNTNQVSSANAEYQNILSEIGDIGSTTNFNGNSVFTSTSKTVFVSDGTASGANSYNETVGTLGTSGVGESVGATVLSLPTPTTPTATTTVQQAVSIATPVAALVNPLPIAASATPSASSTLTPVVTGSTAFSGTPLIATGVQAGVGGAAYTPSTVTAAPTTGSFSSTDTYSGVVGVRLVTNSGSSQLYTAAVAPGSSLQTVVTSLNNSFGYNPSSGNASTSGLQASIVNNALVVTTSPGTLGKVSIDAPTNSLQVSLLGTGTLQNVSFGAAGGVSTTTAATATAQASTAASAIVSLGTGLVQGTLSISSSTGTQLGLIDFGSVANGNASDGITGIEAALATTLGAGTSGSGVETYGPTTGALAGYTASLNTSTGALTLSGPSSSGASFEVGTSTSGSGVLQVGANTAINSATGLSGAFGTTAVAATATTATFAIGTQAVSGQINLLTAGGVAVGTLNFGTGTSGATAIQAAITSAFAVGGALATGGFSATYSGGNLTITGPSTFEASTTAGSALTTSAAPAAGTNNISVSGTASTLSSSTATTVGNGSYTPSSLTLGAASPTNADLYSGTLTAQLAGNAQTYTATIAAGSTVTQTLSALNAAFGSSIGANNTTVGSIGASGLVAIATSSGAIKIESAAGAGQAVVDNASTFQVNPGGTGSYAAATVTGTTSISTGYTATQSGTAATAATATVQLGTAAVAGTLNIYAGTTAQGTAIGSINFGASNTAGSVGGTASGTGSVEAALAATFTGAATANANLNTVTYAGATGSNLDGYSATYNTSTGALTIAGPANGNSFSLGQTTTAGNTAELQTGTVSTTFEAGPGVTPGAQTVYSGTINFGSNNTSYAITTPTTAAALTAGTIQTNTFLADVANAGLSVQVNSSGELQFTNTSAAATAPPAVTITNGVSATEAYTASSVTFSPTSGTGSNAVFTGNFSIAENGNNYTTTFSNTTGNQALAILNGQTPGTGVLGSNLTASLDGTTGALIISGVAPTAPSGVAAAQITVNSTNNLSGVTSSTQTLNNANASANTTYTGTISFGAVGTTAAGSYVIGSNGAGTTAAQIAQALNTSGVLGGSSTGIVASVNQLNQLVFSGPTTGAAQAQAPGVTLTNVTATAPAATTYSASTAAFAANSGGTFSGQLTVGTSGTGQIASTVAAGTTLANLVTQLNNQYTQLGVSDQLSASAGTGSQAGQLIISSATPTTAAQATSDQLIFSQAAGANTLLATSATSTNGGPGAGVDFTAASIDQLTANSAQTVLSAVTTAINDVAYQRGIIGADVNELTAASNVASAESVNLTSAQSSIQSTDYGAATSDLAKYQVLSQTGISALAQANSVQQEVLKLLQ